MNTIHITYSYIMIKWHTQFECHLYLKFRLWSDVYVCAVFILGVFSTVLRRDALLPRRIALVPAEVPLFPAVLPFFICCISSTIPHSLLGVSPNPIAWPILYYRDYNGSLIYVYHIVCMYDKSDVLITCLKK